MRLAALLMIDKTGNVAANLELIDGAAPEAGAGAVPATCRSPSATG